MRTSFSLPAHREIFDAMLALDKRQAPIDPISLGDELKTRGTLPRLEGGQAYLNSLANDVPTAENIAHYTRIVKEKSVLRRLISTCAELQSRAYGEFGEYEQFLDEAENAVFQVAQKTRPANYAPIGEHIPDVLENIQARARQRKAVTGVPTGFTKFDEMTAGLQPETLIVIAARPGCGKTSFSVNVAMNAALDHKVPVLIFSLEMSKFELMERMLAGVARVDSGLIKKGMIEYADWKSKIYPAGEKLAEAPILIDDGASPTILDIRAKARRFRSDIRFFPPKSNSDKKGIGDRPLGLIVIDYLQLARGGASKGRQPRAGNRRNLPWTQGSGQGLGSPHHRHFPVEPWTGKA